MTPTPDQDQSTVPGRPAVSIILPAFNRAAFLPGAIAAIRGQTFSDWELIVVDDGSTDDTAAVVDALAGSIPQPVHFHRQENQGAYGARNAGLELARGRYVAFYDSDDLWLPHHLSDCVDGLDACPEVDWVFSACRRVEHRSGRVLLANTFYHADGTGWPFLDLQTRAAGRLRILDDPTALACMLAGGLNCGLQASVIRRRLFDNYRFQTRFRNEAEDQMAVIWTLANGGRMAYLEAVHVVYHVHSQNSSATAAQGVDKRVAVLLAEARGYEELPDRRVPLKRAERRALRQRLLTQYFWQVGYALLWQNGRRSEALAAFRRGLGHWPWSPRCWKTAFLALCRTVVGGRISVTAT